MPDPEKAKAFGEWIKTHYPEASPQVDSDGTSIFSTVPLGPAVESRPQMTT